MAATLKQIAELAGVSIGTVDRALNNRGRISPEVKRRVLEIAKALDYAPNVAAKSLVIRRKNLKLGYVSHVQQNEYHDMLLEGVRRAADEIGEYGVEVLVRETNDFHAEDQLRLLGELAEAGVAGVAVDAINDPRVKERLVRLHEAGTPFVFAGGYIEDAPCLCAIGHDVKRRCRLAANLFDLCTEGPVRLMVFTPSLSMLGHVRAVEGLRECLAADYPRIAVAELVELQNDEISNYNIVGDAMRRHPEANAALFLSAVISGGLRALRDTCAPGSVRTISTFYSPTLRPALLSGEIAAAVTHSPQEVGYRAVKTLFNYIAFDQAPPAARIDVEHRILLRQSFWENETPERS